MFNFCIDDFRNVHLPSEEEIMRKWIGDNDKPVASVICITYNHELYVEDAIRGFLIQKTTFPFEIIIHDDASSDRTAEIIMNYANKYPKIIKPILQKENQYSKAPISVLSIPFKVASGDFLAFCEGDDFWFSNSKLENQVMFLKSNKDYSICIDDAIVVNNEVNKTIERSKLKRLNVLNGIYNEAELNNRFILMLIGACFKNIREWDFPGYFNKSINGDTLIQLILANHGKAMVSDCDATCAYRIHEQGVWSMKDKTYKMFETMHTMLVHAQYLNNNSAARKEKFFSLIIMAVNQIGIFKFIKIFLWRLSLKLGKLVFVSK